MKKGNLTIWLIILLCLIISFLVWLTSYNSCSQKTYFLNQQIKSLNQQLEKIKKEKNQSETCPSVNLTPKTSTPSGKKY